MVETRESRCTYRLTDARRGAGGRSLRRSDGARGVLTDGGSQRGRMVLYSCTEAMCAAAKAATSDAAVMRKLPAPAQAALRQCKPDCPGLDPAALQALSEGLKAARGPRLHEVMQGSKPTLPKAWYPPEKPKRTPEQEAYLEDLRAKAEQRKYDAMVHRVTAAERAARDPTNFSGLKDASSQMAMAFNVIVAMATAFTVGYWIGKFNEWEHTQNLLLGTAFLVATLFIEVILLIIYVYKHEMDENKEVFKEFKAKQRTDKARDAAAAKDAEALAKKAR